MKKKVIDKIINNLKNSNKYNDSQIRIIKYGLETLYLTITKFVIVFGFSLILNTTKEFTYFFVFFTIIKSTGFGLHTKKSYQCWVLTIPLFVIIPILIKYLVIGNYILYILLPISYLILIIYAPADTEKRPLINKKKRILYKTLTTITASVYIILIFFLNNSILTSSLFYSLMLESLIVNPISYKLFGLKYKNYKKYERRI